MKVAIVGLPGAGKSSVFAAVTGTPVDPHAVPEVRRAVVRVPEPRLEFLARLCKPKKITEATVEYVDIPGGSPSDGGHSDSFRRCLPELRLCDALAVVVRDHDNPSVPAYRDRIDARADVVEIWDELLFADLDAVTTRIERLEKSLRKPTASHDQERHEIDLMNRFQAALESGEALSTVVTTDEERRQTASFAFVTPKPLIVIRNVSEDRINEPTESLSEHAGQTVTLCAAAEAEIAALDPDDREAFFADLRIEVPARDWLIQSCYQALGLISFFTLGPEEVRATPIRAGTTALEAAAKIHTDMARGFIRAETVAYDDLVAHGDIRGAKAAGKVRQEGKSYIVADGDVINFKFNV